MNKKKALLIGCGNIGALYDYYNKQIISHAKAYTNNENFTLSVYDVDTSLSKKISEKYNAHLIEDIDQLNFSNFDSVSICTPTDTHFVFLKKSLIANVKAIICEKPISYSIHELNQLSDLQKVSSSTVIVNYLRRFQPSYVDLKLKISELQYFTELKSILIKYQKGFINNCSHAIDLIQFLFSKEINLDVLNKSIIDYKFSKNDPTISLNAFWNKIPINIVGISEISYPVFEIELFFNDFRISILESGQKIIFYPQQIKSITLPLKVRLNCIDNYMIPVIEKAEKVIKDGNVCSNLSESILLNKKMLEILSL